MVLIMYNIFMLPQRNSYFFYFMSPILGGVFDA